MKPKHDWRRTRALPALVAALGLSAGQLAQADGTHVAYLPWVAQPPAPEIQPLGQIGGAVTAIAIAGRYAYAGVGGRVVVLDVADPARPREVGTTSPLFGSVTDIEVVGDTVFAASSAAWVSESEPWQATERGLLVFDVADRTRPRLASRHLRSGNPWRLAGGRGLLLVLDGREPLLQVLDVSARPTTIAAIGTFTLGLNEADRIVDLVTDGVMAWVIVIKFDGDGPAKTGMLTVDLADPTTPRGGEVVWIDDSASRISVTGMAHHGRQVFIGDGNNGLWVFDIAQPDSPRMLYTPTDVVLRLGLRVRQPVGALASTAEGRLVVFFVERGNTDDGYNHLRLIDVRDPDRISLAGEMYPPPHHGWTLLAVSGRIAIALRARGRIDVIGLADLVQPSAVGTWLNPISNVSRIAMGDAGVVFVVNDRDDLPRTVWAIDASDRIWPKPIAEAPITRARVHAMTARHGFLYLATETDVSIIDVRDRRAMRTVSRLAGRGHVRDFAWGPEGHLLVVESDDVGDQRSADTLRIGGLRIVDVTQPAAPREVGYVPGNMHVIAAAGRYAWVAALATSPAGESEDDLHLYDIGDPRQPVRLAQFEYPMPANAIDAIVATPDHAYVAQLGSLFIHSRTSGTRPTLRLVNMIENVEPTLALTGDTLFIAGQSDPAVMVTALDLRDPVHPAVRRRWRATRDDPMRFHAGSLALGDGFLMVGTTTLGVWIFDLRVFSRTP